MWIEHCDIYRSGDEAREDYSGIVPGDPFVLHWENPIFDPDKRTAHSLVRVVSAKLRKTTYEPLVKKYGKGVLVSNERDNLFDHHTLRVIAETVTESGMHLGDCHFRAVYLGVRVMGGLDFVRVLPR
jgi:hypothetical protein